ncbi:MAG: hypothetical protein EXR93_01990 [Gemmatimonadetes bacterium]|nr:hypothetical protein [Gemmatimonadota bacterium]
MRRVVGMIYVSLVAYCVLWGLVFLRSPLLSFQSPDIDVPWLLRLGEFGGVVLLVAGIASATLFRHDPLASHLAWLGVTLMGVMAMTIMGAGVLFVAWWLDWEPAAFAAMACWGLAGLWSLARLLFGFARFLAGHSVSRWPLRAPAA